jgi:exonuclease SbcD
LHERLELLKLERPFIGHFLPCQLLIRPAQQLSKLAEETAALSDLDPTAVFIKKCESVFPGTDYSDLLSTLQEALDAMQQQEGQP